ncbi:MAG: serine/threonine-protein kinase [Pseudomonadota bacterium]
MERDDATRIDVPHTTGTESPASLLAKGSHVEVKIGDLLDQRFLLERELGRGGMGVVYRARDLIKEDARDPDPHVAIKVLTSKFAEHPDAWISLQREIKKTQALAHPRITTVHDFKIDRVMGVPFAQMEELRGRPLSALLLADDKGIADQGRAREITISIAEGLAYAHQRGVVHADLKPSNVFITDSSGVKLLDFGISRFASNNTQDAFDSLSFDALTPTYASPQVFSGESPDTSDDIFALGVLCYEMACGQHPFGRFLHSPEPSVAALAVGFRPKKPARLSNADWRVIKRCLSYDRAARPANGSVFLSQFKQKNLKLVLVAAAVSLTLGVSVTSWLTPDGPTPAQDVADLPASVQAELASTLQFADEAFSMRDYNGALVYFSKAFDLHPYNPDAVAGLEDIVDIILSDSKPDSRDQAEKAAAQIETLISYPALAESKKLHAYRRELQQAWELTSPR